MFSGLLTLAGFILTLKTFIIITLKTAVYDADSTLRAHIRAIDSGEEGKLYDGLRSLGSIMSATVVVSLVAALLQISLGQIDRVVAQAFVLGTAASAVFLVFRTWYYIQRNLTDYFVCIESTAKDLIHEVRQRDSADAERIEKSTGFTSGK